MNWNNLNLANRITLVRLFLIPFVLLFMLLPVNSFIQSFLGGNLQIVFNIICILTSMILFAVASITDYLDGHLARKYNMVTVLGKFLDPVVDKCLILAVWIGFVQIGKMNAVIPVIVLLREFLVTGIRLIAAEKGQVLAAKLAGKLKTVLQIIATLLLYFNWILLQINSSDSNFIKIVYSTNILANLVLVLSLVAAIFSAYIYIKQNKDLF